MNLSKITSKQMTDVFKNNPPILANKITKDQFIGLNIETSGKITSIDIFSPRITLNFKDESGVSISANFDEPISPEVSVLSKGDKVKIVGKVFNVGEGIVVLDYCNLEHDNNNSIKQENKNAVVLKNKKQKMKERKWLYNPWLLALVPVLLSSIIGGGYIFKSKFTQNHLGSGDQMYESTKSEYTQKTNIGDAVAGNKTENNYYNTEKKEYTKEQICSLYYNCPSLGGPGTNFCTRAEQIWGQIIKCKGVKTFLEMNPNIIIK